MTLCWAPSSGRLHDFSFLKKKQFAPPFFFVGGSSESPAAAKITKIPEFQHLPLRHEKSRETAEKRRARARARAQRRPVLFARSLGGYGQPTGTNRSCADTREQGQCRFSKGECTQSHLIVANPALAPRARCFAVPIRWTLACHLCFPRMTEELFSIDH